MSLKRLFLISTFLSILIVSCAPQEEVNPGSSWDYADLRFLSSHKDLLSAGDFIAGYARDAGSDLQLRFDLLEVELDQDSDFYVALDTAPGGLNQLPIKATTEIEWDTLLVLPASGNPRAYKSSNFDVNNSDLEFTDQYQIRNDLIPRLVKIAWQDYILISINRASLPLTTKGFNIQAFSTEPGSIVVKDSIGPFSSESLPPKQAPILLTFWNSFPAYTPAQTLRRWDGAHTGPFGERHGLSILLKNVQQTGVPVALLDLRNQFSLSALDYLGALPLIKELVSKKLLILPEPLPGSPSYPVFPEGLPDWAPDKYLQDLRDTSHQFDLPASAIFYAPNQVESITGDYWLIFGSGDDLYQSTHQGKFLPIPPQTSDELQATPDGLPVAIRKQLIDNALQVNLGRGYYPLMILGGSLPSTSFADPASAAATLSYIANHPWIKPLNEHDLQTLPSRYSPQLLPGVTTAVPQEGYLPANALTNLPNPRENDRNPLFQSAWDSALSLYAPLPPEPEILPDLRSNYAGQPGITLAAAKWADSPQPRSDCLTDPDYDGVPECILASNRQFAVIDIEGARLVAYYVLSKSGIHQIIAPTSQFIVGLGDPSSWLLNAGEGADSAGIHGAFVDSPPPWMQYELSTNGEGISFTTVEQGITKIFSLSDSELNVKYLSPQPITVQIPIAIDPWGRFSPGWSDAYHCQSIQYGYSCRIEDVFEVEIVTDSSISAKLFTDSQEKLAIPEDPNFNYPAGHYLPFPIALLEIESQGEFTVQFRTSP
jgi:hypothetical protein